MAVNRTSVARGWASTPKPGDWRQQGVIRIGSVKLQLARQVLQAAATAAAGCSSLPAVPIDDQSTPVWRFLLSIASAPGTGTESDTEDIWSGGIFEIRITAPFLSFLQGP